MWKRQKQNASSSSSEVDWCKNIVKRIEEVLKCGKVLNERQCRSLAEKLSVGIGCIRKAVGCCEKHKPAFVPLLRALYRYYEKAEVLVTHCRDEDWCVAAIFQRGNTASFEDIIEHVSSLGMLTLWCRRQHACPMDITTIENTFKMTFENHVNGDEDEEELRTRLEVLASELGNNNIASGCEAEQVDVKQYLARYLLKKNKIEHELGYSFSSLNSLKMHLWEKDDAPTRTWGESKFLGAGSGASGVCKTSWLGVTCAKKEYHGEANKAIFMNEVSIMARLKHPCIVDFICCGNGEGKGDRFIAMELMEKSLLDLIEEQKGVPFALDVALDIILQIANGVKYLHEQGVAHRDLKPQNVIVKTLRSPHHNDYYHVKLVDFGTCKSEVEAAKSNIMSQRGVGTTRYRAPEVHPSAHPTGLGRVEWFKADAYSFAMTCAHVLTLKQPFDNLESLSKLYKKIKVKGERLELPNAYPKELVALVKECWSTSRYERPEFDTIYARLESITVNNMLVSFSNFWNEMTFPVPNNVRRDVIKKEQVQIKEECQSNHYSAQGHTSFFSAQDVSLCNDVVSQEWEYKSDVSKQPVVKDSRSMSRPRNCPVVEQVKFTPPKVEDISDDYIKNNGSPAGHSMDVFKGPLFKEVACLRAHTCSVYSCHFSSDGKLLASAGFHDTVALWNMETMEQKSSDLEEEFLSLARFHPDSTLQELSELSSLGQFHPDSTLQELSSLVWFHPDSTLLATSSLHNNTVRVWKADMPNDLLQTFTGHQLQVNSLDFHPNTKDLLCSCAFIEEIRYWSVNQGVCTRVFQGGMKQVRFQPQQGRLLAAVASNVVSIFDVESGTCVHALQRHTNFVQSVCWDAAGDLLASVSEDSVQVWNVGSRGAQGECVYELGCCGDKFNSCVFHPTYPSMLVIGCHKSLELWNIINNQRKTVPAHEGWILDLASSAATGMVASASLDGSVRLWKAEHLV